MFIDVTHERCQTRGPGAQNQLAKDSNLAHWIALENVKKGINFLLF